MSFVSTAISGIYLHTEFFGFCDCYTLVIKHYSLNVKSRIIGLPCKLPESPEYMHAIMDPVKTVSLLTFIYNCLNYSETL